MLKFIDTTVFTGQSTTALAVTDTTKVSLMNAKEVHAPLIRRRVILKALTAQVDIGKKIALDGVLKGTVIHSASLFTEAVTSGTLDLVVCDKTGTVLQTIKSAASIASASAQELIARSATVAGVEITADGILAFVVGGANVPVGFDGTLLLDVVEL